MVLKNVKCLDRSNNCNISTIVYIIVFMQLQLCCVFTWGRIVTDPSSSILNGQPHDVDQRWVQLQPPETDGHGATQTQAIVSTNVNSNSINNYDDELDDYNGQLTSRVTTGGAAVGVGFGGGNIRRSNGYERSDNRNRMPINRNDDDPLFRPRTSKCDRRIRVLNGATRIRDKGSLVRFQCSYGYHMLGVSVAVCVRGKWSDDPPVCVRDGCRKLPVPLQGSLRLLYGGGVAVFNCNYGYEMEGERLLACDGQRWNGTVPICKEIPPITIAPPSTTFPTLPYLVTTEETSTEDVIPVSPTNYTSTTTATAPPSTPSLIPNQTGDAPANPEVDTSDQDYASVSSSPPEDLDPFLIDPIQLEVSTASYVKTKDKNEDGEWAASSPNYISTTMSTISKDAPSPTSPPSIPTDSASTLKPLTTTTHRSTSLTSITTKFTTTRSNSKSTAATYPETTTATAVEADSTTENLPSWARTIPSRPAAKISTQKPEPPADVNPLPYIPNPRISPTPAPPTKGLEIVPAIITPEKLENSGSSLGHIFTVSGTILGIAAALTIIGSAVTCYWRKNKGIARARSQDIDGRILNLSVGSNDDYWSENRDSGL